MSILDGREIACSPIFSSLDIEEMRGALIDASPLSQNIKNLLHLYGDRYIIHRDIVRLLGKICSSDYPESIEAEIMHLVSSLED